MKLFSAVSHGGKKKIDKNGMLFGLTDEPSRKNQRFFFVHPSEKLWVKKPFDYWVNIFYESPEFRKRFALLEVKGG